MTLEAKKEKRKQEVWVTAGLMTAWLPRPHPELSAPWSNPLT